MQSTSIRFLATLLLTVALVQVGRGQDLSAQHRQIRAAIDRNDPASAMATLQALRTSNGRLFELNNYDYLLARLAERNGDYAGALATYQAVVRRNSQLCEYALWHLAQLARANGDLVREREQLNELIMFAPASRLHDAATMRLGQSFFESADYLSAIVALRKIGGPPNTSLARQALTLVAEALARSGWRAQARETFGKLLSQMPDLSRPDDFALAAARGLDSLDKADRAQTVSEADHLLRANIYQFNRQFVEARSHYQAVLDAKAHAAANESLIYQMGRGLYQEGKFDEAARTLLPLISDQYQESQTKVDAALLLASAYGRLKQPDRAIQFYKWSIKNHPDAPNPERPYLNIIDVLRDAGRDEEALAYVRQTRTQFKDQVADALALFAQAKIELAKGAWARALSSLEELQQAKDLGGTRVPGGTTAAEVAFLRALALDNLGRTDEAINAYLSIPEGRNEYYGFRANERLRALSANSKSQAMVAAKLASLRAEIKRAVESGDAEAVRRAGQAALRLASDSSTSDELRQTVGRVYAILPAYRFPSFTLLSPGRQEVLTNEPANSANGPSPRTRTDELFFLGLYDEAIPEFAAARLSNDSVSIAPGSSAASGLAKNSQGVSDLDFTVAVFSLRGDLPYPAVRFAEQVWRGVPSDYVIELAPHDLVELLFPAPYRASLLKHTGARQIDPRFVLAIARQETRFQAEAKSAAAARGLMQFISATANDVAKELGRQNFQQEELYNADTAIQFGSQYLASLSKQFPSMPEAVAGSYNGGADNLARWIDRSHSKDPARYVSEVGFAQTKDYIFRVMSNYWIYQKLYSDQLQRQ